MPIRAVLHVPGEESILCEIEEVPKPTDNFVIIYNPRRKDGKVIATLADGVTSVIFPWARVSYLELMEEQRSQREQVVGFFRESDTRRRP